MTDITDNTSPILYNIVNFCIFIFIGLVFLYVCVGIICAIVMMVKHVKESKPEDFKKYPCPDPATCDILFCNCEPDEMEKGQVVVKAKGPKYERFL